MYKKTKGQINIEFHQKIDISQPGCPTNKGNKKIVLTNMVNYYENLVVGEIRLSSKAIESLEQNGIFEFQWNEPMAGLYDVCIYRDHQTDNIIVSLQKKAVSHLFTFIVPSHLREIKIGKEEISLKFL